MSLAVHALVIFIVIGTSGSLKPSNKLLIIDFRMENPTGTTKESIRATAYESRHQTEGITQKPGTMKEAQKEQRDQKSTREEQRQETPILTTPEIHETSASERQLPILAQSKPDTGPDDKRQDFAMLDGSHNTAPAETGMTDSSSGMRGAGTTGNEAAYGGTSGGPNRLRKTEYLRKNFSYIRDMIQKRISYPALAKRMGWEGKVTVFFMIVSDGRVKDVEVKESSGRDVFDKSAIETIRTASPFPEPPSEAQIIIPILYQLN